MDIGASSFASDPDGATDDGPRLQVECCAEACRAAGAAIEAAAGHVGRDATGRPPARLLPAAGQGDEERSRAARWLIGSACGGDGRCARALIGECCILGIRASADELGLERLGFVVPPGSIIGTLARRGGSGRLDVATERTVPPGFGCVLAGCGVTDGETTGRAAESATHTAQGLVRWRTVWRRRPLHHAAIRSGDRRRLRLAHAVTGVTPNNLFIWILP
jgi:hypothetical protein